MNWILVFLFNVCTIFYCSTSVLAGSPGTVEFSSFSEWSKRGHEDFFEKTTDFMNKSCGNLEAKISDLYVLGYFPKISDINYGIYRYDKGCISEYSCPIFVVTYDYINKPQYCEYAGHSSSKSGHYRFLQRTCPDVDKNIMDCDKGLVDRYEGVTSNSSIYIEKYHTERQKPVVKFKE